MPVHLLTCLADEGTARRSLLRNPILLGSGGFTNEQEVSIIGTILGNAGIDTGAEGTEIHV